MEQLAEKFISAVLQANALLSVTVV